MQQVNLNFEKNPALTLVLKVGRLVELVSFTDQVKHIFYSSWQNSSLRALPSFQRVRLSTSWWPEDCDARTYSLDEAMNDRSYILHINFFLATCSCLIINRIELELNRLVLEKLEVLHASEAVVEQLAGVRLITGHDELRMLAGREDAVLRLLLEHLVVKKDRLLPYWRAAHSFPRGRCHQWLHWRLYFGVRPLDLLRAPAVVWVRTVSRSFAWCPPIHLGALHWMSCFDCARERSVSWTWSSTFVSSCSHLLLHLLRSCSCNFGGFDAADYPDLSPGALLASLRHLAFLLHHCLELVYTFWILAF